MSGSKIERARLDGSDRETFINVSIRAPLALAIDCEEDVLYWCDQRLNKIDRVDLKTRNSTTIVANVTDCMGLSLYGEHIYWVDMYVLFFYCLFKL